MNDARQLGSLLQERLPRAGIHSKELATLGILKAEFHLLIVVFIIAIESPPVHETAHNSARFLRNLEEVLPRCALLSRGC